MKHKIRRIISLASVLTIGGCALGMFAGCTTKHPEVTITYSFNGQNYAVRFVLSRNDAPQTVQHFLELADAGFYDGMCIHDYQSDMLYSGGYYLDGTKLEEVDYLTKVKEIEESKSITFTQSVWTAADKKTPLYTVFGEFEDNAVTTQYSRENRHTAGALVMYYTSKGAFNEDVFVERADGGKRNDGVGSEFKPYSKNSATSLFYMFTGNSNMMRDRSYCVFGMADEEDYEKQIEKGLLAAIAEYQKDLDEDKSFTEERTVTINTHDYFVDVASAGEQVTYNTPVDRPITIKSIKVNKY